MHEHELNQRRHCMKAHRSLLPPVAEWRAQNIKPLESSIDALMARSRQPVSNYRTPIAIHIWCDEVRRIILKVAVPAIRMHQLVRCKVLTEALTKDDFVRPGPSSKWAIDPADQPRLYARRNFPSNTRSVTFVGEPSLVEWLWFSNWAIGAVHHK